MSLARACLRLAAVAALRGATLAETRVFDSRIGAIEGLKPEERKPVIAVYTEDQSGEPLSSQNGGPPFRPHVELVFEITMVEAQFDEADQFADVGCPTTDGELEATLDTLEQEVRVVLFEDMTKPLAVLFRRAFLRATHYQSLRFREEKTGTRLAYRYVIIKLEVADEPVLGAYDGTAMGLDRLPRPFREIAKAWPDDLPEKAVATAMAARFAQPAVVRGLEICGEQRVGPSAEVSVTAAGGNTGSGILVMGAVDPGTEPGAYVVKFVSASTFIVYGPGLRSKTPGDVSTPFAGQIAFTTENPSGFATGDSFTVTVAATGLPLLVTTPAEAVTPHQYS